MTSVGEAKTTAYVHELTTPFRRRHRTRGALCYRPQTEAVPNLLGRHSVCSTSFRSISTRAYSRPVSDGRWLNENHTRMWRFLSDTAKHIGERYELETLPHPADSGRGELSTPCGRTDTWGQWSGQVAHGPMLVRCSFGRCSNWPSIVRVSHGGTLSATPNSIAISSTSQGTSTTSQRLRDPAGPIVRLLASSPQRPAGERRIKTLYDQVRGRFAKGKTNKIMGQLVLHDGVRAWPPVQDGRGSITFGTAGAVSGHTLTPLGMDPSLALPPDTTLLVCYHYYARMLLRLADHTSVVLTAEQYEFLTKLTQELS